jgi:hypothetical protein
MKIRKARHRQFGTMQFNYPYPTDQQILSPLIWHYHQYQVLWHCSLALNPPDWEMLEELSSDMSRMEEELSGFGVLL